MFINFNQQILQVEISGSDISETSVFILEYADYNISCPFDLISIRNYDTLDQIGPTQVNNNIWLTATSTVENGQLKVALYPINKTEYTFKGFNTILQKQYFGKKLQFRCVNSNISNILLY